MNHSLESLVFQYLHEMTHNELSRKPKKIANLDIPEQNGLTKKERIDFALKDITKENLAHIALKLGSALRVPLLEEAGQKELECKDPPLTRITRRDIARLFGNNLAGERKNLEVVNICFPMSRFEGLFGESGKNLREDIEENMDLNPGNWSVEKLFEKIGAFDCSKARFGSLLEQAVQPLSRSGDEQIKTVAALNKLLSKDKYELVKESEISGHPIFKFCSLLRGVNGRPKNLIFASIGVKPEIGLSDAINNDIVILSGEENCLVYDQQIGTNGLLWADLVSWWGTINPGADAKNLGSRLRKSLASEAEKNIFDQYFKIYHPVLEKKLPAILPQVYLHYDPAIVKNLYHRDPLPRQRMDFLILLPNSQRIVIEVDGKHHFSRNDIPSLDAYADMVSADRELRLAGYEIYRFGANELFGKSAKNNIKYFFDKLFSLHNIKKY